MNNMVKNLPTWAAMAGGVASTDYGYQTLSEAAHKSTSRRRVFYSGSLQLELQLRVRPGRRAMKPSTDRGYDVAVKHLSGEWTIAEAKNLSLSACVREAETAGSMPAPRSQDEIRYRELTGKRFTQGLSAGEQEELDAIQGRLDAADEADPHLQAVSTRISAGYEHLREELRNVNAVLDRLLKR